MLTIGKIARAANVTADTLRYYERVGLLCPASKTPSGYRLYDTGAMRRIRLIRQAQQCGFSLSDIRELLGLKSRRSACCSDVRSVAIEKKLEIEARIKTLQAISRTLDQLIDRCVDPHQPLGSCPILSSLENEVIEHR
ncbi:MAG: heavy metal-responsive transcriptional regulator [Betaproteobacteria bacterium]